MENKIIYGIIIIMLAFIAFVYFLPDSNLCTYKIPNHVRLNCTDGNSSKIVNSFEITLFQYENALSKNCTYIEAGKSFNTSRYEVGDCNLDVPFEIRK